MAELQKAVTLAERRAIDTVAGERIKMERLLIEASRNKTLMGNSSDDSIATTLASGKCESEAKQPQENQASSSTYSIVIDLNDASSTSCGKV